jgi:hypothetical protein
MKSGLVYLCFCAIASAAEPVFSQEMLAASQECRFVFKPCDNSTYAILDQASVDEWEDGKITWREGDSVVALSPSGVASVLVDGAQNAGGSGFAFNQGGLWKLVNSKQGEVVVGVAWNVFGDGGKLAENTLKDGFFAESRRAGPDRRVFVGETVPVAFSPQEPLSPDGGERELNLVSPSGNAMTLRGAASQNVCFSERGNWTVTRSSGAEEQTATICVRGRSTKIYLR